MGMDKQEFQFQFQLEQFKALRKEIEDNLSQIRRLVYLDVLGSGAVWYLVFSDNVPKPLKIPLSITSIFLSGLCAIYVAFLRRDIRRLGLFLIKVEDTILEQGVQLGWEKYLVSRNLKNFQNTETFEAWYSLSVVILNTIGVFLLDHTLSKNVL